MRTLTLTPIELRRLAQALDSTGAARQAAEEQEQIARHRCDRLLREPIRGAVRADGSLAEVSRILEGSTA